MNLLLQIYPEDSNFLQAEKEGSLIGRRQRDDFFNAASRADGKATPFSIIFTQVSGCELSRNEVQNLASTVVCLYGHKQTA